MSDNTNSNRSSLGNASTRFFGSWIVLAIASGFAIWMVPGIHTVGDTLSAILIASLCLALVNATIKPIAQGLALPVTILTLGVFYLFVNAMLLELASWLSRNIFTTGIVIESFGSAFLGAIIISIVSTIVSATTGLGE
jgi:putative membrane protein